jgi:hypothetical protein
VCSPKAYGGVEVYVHSFLTEALRYGHFTPTEGTLVPLGKGGCVGPGAGLEFFLEEKPFAPVGNGRSISSLVYSVPWSV